MTRIEAHQGAKLSVAQWVRWIRDCAASANSTQHQPSYNYEVRSLVQDAMPELSAAEEWLLELHVGLFLLRKHWTYSYTGYYVNIARTETMNDILRQLALGLPTETIDSPWALLQDTVAYIRQTAMHEKALASVYLDVYAELWIRFLAPSADSPGRFEEELTRLENEESRGNGGDVAEPDAENGQMVADLEGFESIAAVEDVGTARGTAGLSGSGSPKRSLLFLTGARAWMYYWLGEDRQAWQQLELAAQEQLKPAQVLRFLNVLEEAEDWSRLEAWMSGCATDRLGRQYNSIQAYGSYWDIVVEHLPEAEERMWEAIGSLLPFSRGLYEKRLLRYGRWRLWIDYQISIGEDPLDFRVRDLQPIEKGDPETLLPWYHQSVERHILLRNRDGYKRAVKLLKRLAKLYKRLKREPRWEAYVDDIAKQYSRLRAFQEELRKGKLIP